MFWFLCPPSHGGNSRLLALQQSFDSRFSFFCLVLREQTSRVSRKEMLESTHSSYYSQGIIYHLPFSSLKERKALISSTRIMGMNLNSRSSAHRETRRVNHIIMELNFILPFRASCSLFQQQPWMRIGEGFWDSTREVFPVLHDSVVHLMSR